MPITNTNNTSTGNNANNASTTGNTVHSSSSTNTAASTTSTNASSSNSGSTSTFQSMKNAARDFLSRDQQHNTEVRENYKPAIVRETISPSSREEITTAVDREVHQDHYQTRIQPVEEHIQTSEAHAHKTLPVETREKTHNKHAEVKKRLDTDAAQFKSTTSTMPTKYEAATSSGTLAGEHIHHHVHETVQPIIEREVVQPSVVHTTKPIHEKVVQEPTFHPATVQPKMTIQEFKDAGGSLEGKKEVREVFEGEPQVRENGGAGERKTGGRVGAVGGRKMKAGLAGEAPVEAERVGTPEELPVRA